MKVLGIDTSSLATSVAVIEDNKLICEYTINTKKTHSQKLMPMIENMLNISDLNINEIDLIAVCEGPGSFTGLRIAMATAKAIAHVNNLPIVGINSVELLAGNMNLCDKKICSILDAQRTQVYMGQYKFEDNKLVELKGVDVVEIDDLIEELKDTNEEGIIVGEAVYKYEDKWYVTVFAGRNKINCILSEFCDSIAENMTEVFLKEHGELVAKGDNLISMVKGIKSLD